MTKRYAALCLHCKAHVLSAADTLATATTSALLVMNGLPQVQRQRCPRTVPPGAAKRHAPGARSVGDAKWKRVGTGSSSGASEGGGNTAGDVSGEREVEDEGREVGASFM